jgi:hypothetical protein
MKVYRGVLTPEGCVVGVYTRSNCWPLNLFAPGLRYYGGEPRWHSWCAAARALAWSLLYECNGSVEIADRYWRPFLGGVVLRFESLRWELADADVRGWLAASMTLDLAAGLPDSGECEGM